jgi:hypothetical protein
MLVPWNLEYGIFSKGIVVLALKENSNTCLWSLLSTKITGCGQFDNQKNYADQGMCLKIDSNN